MAQVGKMVAIRDQRQPSEYTDAELAAAVLVGHRNRQLAAEVLRRVAKEGAHGNYPHAIPPEVLGRAVFQLATNWTPNPEAEIPLEPSVVEVAGRLMAGFYDRPVR